MPSSRPTSAALAAALALVLAGCGGDETEGAFKERVERRCAAYQDERKAAAASVDQRLNEKDPSDLTPAELRRLAPGLRRVQQATARVVADLERLPRPAGGQPELKEAFAHARAGVAAEAKGVEAAARGDGKAMLAAFAETGEEFSAANRAGEDHGFKACG